MAPFVETTHTRASTHEKTPHARRRRADFMLTPRPSVVAISAYSVSLWPLDVRITHRARPVSSDLRPPVHSHVTFPLAVAWDDFVDG